MTRQRRRGESLVEIIVALSVLALILPSIFEGLSGQITAVEALRGQDACRWGAQWWIARIPRPVTEAGLAAMPRSTPDGSASFEWEVGQGEHGAVRVVLTVRARSSGRALVLTRTL